MLTPRLIPSNAVLLAALCLAYWIAWLLIASAAFASALDPDSALLCYLILTALMFFTGLVGMCSFAVSSPAWDAAEAMTLAVPLHALALMAETSQLVVLLIFFSAVVAVLLAARVLLIWLVAKLISQKLASI